MDKLKATHRTTGIVILIVLVYLSITGLMMQVIDLRQILVMHMTPTDPDLRAMLERQGGEFNVLTAADKTAQALPAALDANAALQTVLKSARTTLGDAPLRYVEFRMRDGKLVGNVQTRQMNASFDGVTGSLLNQSPVPPLAPVTSIDRLRYRIKEFHRLTVFGNWALWINIFVGLALVVMVITGVTLYFRMLGQRREQGPSGFFWVGGKGSQEDWKRAMHRGIGLSAAIFLLVVAFSGEWLAYESLVFGYRMQHAMQQRRAGMGPNGPGGQIGQGSPNGARANGMAASGPGANGSGGPGPNRNQGQLLQDADIPAFLGAILHWAPQATNGAPIKVVRIRAFGNGSNAMQGVVISGLGNDTKQIVLNARTGKPLSDDPQAGGPNFPFGWDAHQTGKAVHRGSYFGTWARFLDLFAGLALLYLSINGLALYADFRKERRKARKGQLVAG